MADGVGGGGALSRKSPFHCVGHGVNASDRRFAPTADDGWKWKWELLYLVSWDKGNSRVGPRGW
eukprot:scaffold26151_cov22-Tisochrysis_lutea.AAC.1